MATIIIDGEEQQVADGSPIMDACEDLGVPFACRAGMYGSDVIAVQEGVENLEPKAPGGEDMGVADNPRLACRAIITSGTVVAAF